MKKYNNKMHLNGQESEQNLKRMKLQNVTEQIVKQRKITKKIELQDRN